MKQIMITLLLIVTMGLMNNAIATTSADTIRSKATVTQILSNGDTTSYEVPVQFIGFEEEQPGVVLYTSRDSSFWLEQKGNITENVLIQLINKQLSSKEGYMSYDKTFSLKFNYEDLGISVVSIINPEETKQQFILVSLPSGKTEISDLSEVSIEMYPVPVLGADILEEDGVDMFKKLCGCK